MKIVKFKDLTGKYTREQAIDLTVKILAEQGFVCKGTKTEIKNIRIDTDVFGYNAYALTGRKTKCLTWEQYVNFNKSINRIFDLFKWRAKISGLQGKFVVRDLKGAKHEGTWAPFGREKPVVSFRKEGVKNIARRDYIESLNQIRVPLDKTVRFHQAAA